MLDSCKMVESSLKHSIRFYGTFSKFKTEFFCISFFYSVRLHFLIHQQWQSGFSRVYSISCCSCWFEPEIIEIGQSSHKMYSNKIMNFQEYTTILHAHTKKVWKLIVCTSYIVVNYWHCWRSRDELIRDVHLWIPTHGRAKAGRPARTYIQQLCEDTGCCHEDLPRAMYDREEWRERVRDIRATSAIWWWWWLYIIIIYYYYHHHHHQYVPPARISLTISRHFSLSFITSGKSSGLHPVSSHSCCM